MSLVSQRLRAVQAGKCARVHAQPLPLWDCRGGTTNPSLAILSTATTDIELYAQDGGAHSGTGRRLSSGHARAARPAAHGTGASLARTFEAAAAPVTERQRAVLQTTCCLCCCSTRLVQRA